MSEREPWLNLITVDGILDLHAEGIQKHGGDLSKPQEGCLERSLGAAWYLHLYATPEGGLPYLSFCGGVLYYLVMNHCFTDGNKRIGWTAAMEILRTLGVSIKASDDEAEKFASSGEFVGDSEPQRAVLLRNCWNLRHVESKDLC